MSTKCPISDSILLNITHMQMLMSVLKDSTTVTVMLTVQILRGVLPAPVNLDLLEMGSLVHVRRIKATY